MAEVVRSIKWDEHGDPYLCIQPRINPEKYRPFSVPLSTPKWFDPQKHGHVATAWEFSRDHNPVGFHRLTWQSVEWMFAHWNMGLVTRERWSGIASFIEDGISDLLKAKPRPRPVDVAVQQMTEEIFKEAAKNAEMEGDRIKMTLEVPVEAAL